MPYLFLTLLCISFVFAATLTVRLLDVNDNYPKFEGTNFTFSVSENAQDPSIIATIHADDSDVNRTLTYNLSQGPTPTGSFSIDPGSGK